MRRQSIVPSVALQLFTKLPIVALYAFIYDMHLQP